MLDLNILEELKEKILYVVLEKKNEDFVEKARDKFLLEHDDDTAKGFTSWLIHDFVSEGKSAVDLYKKASTTSIDKYKKKDEDSKDYLEIISNSLYSVFEIVKTENNKILKDIITKRDYLLVDEDDLFNNSIIVGRVYFDDGKAILSEEYTTYSESFKAVFRKGILEKYNDYIKVSGIIDLEDFVKENSSIFYKFVDVVEETDLAVNFDEEEYSVYQAIYAFKERSKIIEILDRIENSSKEEYDETESVYIIKLNEISCELLVLTEKLELECLNRSQLEIFKEKLENILGDYIVHVRDEILTMDELI